MTVSAIAFTVATSPFLPPEQIFVRLNVLAGCVTAVVALVTFCIDPDVLEKDYFAKRRRRKIIATLLLGLAAAFWVSAYLKNFSWVISSSGIAIRAILTIPRFALVASSVATFVLAFIINIRLHRFIQSMWANGDKIDQSYVWKDMRGVKFGRPTSRHVHDHIYGRGSWSKQTAADVRSVRFAAFAAPVGLPLFGICVLGFCDFWSLPAAVLAFVLSCISIAVTVLFREATDG